MPAEGKRPLAPGDREMLRLDLGSVPEGLSHVDLSADTAEWGEPLEGGRIASPVRAQLDINRKGNDLYIRGKARVSAVLECGRCLEEYSCDIETPIEIWVTVREAEQVEERENVIEVSAGAVSRVRDQSQSDDVQLRKTRP
jgi:hypothetical protein